MVLPIAIREVEITQSDGAGVLAIAELKSNRGCLAIFWAQAIRKHRDCSSDERFQIAADSSQSGTVDQSN